MNLKRNYTNKSNRICNIIIGPALMLLMYFVLPDAFFTNVQSKLAVGMICWMAYWWISAPVDYAITGLIPIAANAILRLTDMSSVISNYSSETILLLLGASIIIVGWEECGLDKRIAASFLSIIGTNYRTILLFWFLLSMMLSTILPNAVVCATVTPLAVTMLKYTGENDLSTSQKGSRILLYIAYATGIGGLASPLGGAMNLVTVDYIQQLTGEEYLYTHWVVRFFPIFVAIAIITIIFMLRNVDKNEVIGQSRDYFISQYQSMGKITRNEVIALVLFAFAVILSFSRKLYQNYLPGLKPAYSFIACAILCFVFLGGNGPTKFRWKKIQGKVEWEMIYIFAGGLAAGTIMNESGAADAIGYIMNSIGVKPGFFMVATLLTVTLLLSDVTSNTATAAVAIPVVISMAKGLSVNPIPYVYIASIGVNLSFMLPTSIRAIPVGYGLDPKYMLKEGWKISLIVIIVISILAYLLMQYWPSFSFA